MEDSNFKAQPPRLEKPVRITEQVWPEGTVPVVSVFCITYNHEKFIREAIEGFLIQETTFPVEIFIHDDASTDKTPDIVKEYADKYPKLFWTVLQTENQWSKGNRRIIFDYLSRQRGEFVALCEGDDFWEDASKLQQQFDFLSSTPSFVATVHSRRLIDARGNPLEDIYFPRPYQVDSTEEQLMKCEHILPTLTLMMRNVLKEFPVQFANNVLNGDLFVWSYLGQFGKCKFLPGIKPSVYRDHGGGVWSSLSNNQMILEEMNTLYWIYRYRKSIGETKYLEHLVELVSDKAVLLKSTEQLASILRERTRTARIARNRKAVHALRRFPRRVIGALIRALRSS